MMRLLASRLTKIRCVQLLDCRILVRFPDRVVFVSVIEDLGAQTADIDAVAYVARLLRLAAALSVTPEWLSGMEANAPEPSALLPVAQELDEQGGLRFTEERVPVPRSFLHGGDSGSFFILRVTGLAMYPRLLSGDCLLVEKTAEPKDGAIAVLVQDGALLVRTVSGKTLLPANPEYPPRALDHTARILGRAVMLVRAL